MIAKASKIDGIVGGALARFEIRTNGAFLFKGSSIELNQVNFMVSTHPILRGHFWTSVLHMSQFAICTLEA